MAPRTIMSLLLSTLLALPSVALSEEAPKPAPKPAPIWNYFGGANDDEGWEELSPDFALCKYGDRQSPIAFYDTKRSAMPPLELSYRTSKVRFEKKDRTMVIDFSGNNTLKDHNKTYKLVQMRLHTPAEHQILNLDLHPMELQLIHKDKKGNMLIMSIFGARGPEEHLGLQALLDTMPIVAKKVVEASFNPETLLPDKAGYYAYSGSLSWPPCTEGVEWRVRKQAISISKEQMKAMGKLFGRNARLQQQHYMRPIRETLH